MTRRYTHRNLIAWQRAQELGHQVIQLTKRIAQSWANAILVRRIISSATSVGAIIAEGHGRYTPGAHRNHLLIARGSLAETDSWLDQLRRGDHITQTEEAPLLQECVEITAMLTSKITMLDRLIQDNSSTMHESRANYAASEVVDEPPFPFLSEDYQ